eukprot:scaffold14203_cov47-Prasinocladus_malaysianus.AAC.2
MSRSVGQQCRSTTGSRAAPSAGLAQHCKGKEGLCSPVGPSPAGAMGFQKRPESSRDPGWLTGELH